MKNYVLQDIQKDNGILYLTLAPKKQGANIRFEPGQYATIGFRGPNGRLSPMRCFSITSSSDSGNLQFATRLGGDFTHALADLTAGDEMYVQGPFGEFIINPTYDRNVVLIAGGIGITPFMSMIRSATKAQSSLPITLLYSCRSGQGIPFHDELREMEKRNPKLRVVVFVTDQTNVPEIPRMLSGRMTENHIGQVVGGSYTGSTYFVCGPKGFTESTESMLLAKGVRDDRIVTESFTQASKVTLGGYNLRKATYAFASALLVAGIFSIAFLDLSRYLPRHTVSANAAQSSQTVNNNSSTAGTPSAQTNQPTDSTTVTPSSNSTNNSTSNNSSTNSRSSNYQQPVTSVS